MRYFIVSCYLFAICVVTATALLIGCSVKSQYKYESKSKPSQVAEVEEPQLATAKTYTTIGGIETYVGRNVPNSGEIPKRSEWRVEGNWATFKNPDAGWVCEISPQPDGRLYVITRSPDGTTSPARTRVSVGGASNQLFIEFVKDKE